MTLFEYAQSVTSKFGKTLRTGEVLAKILTTNDDAGRHGVLVPADVYSFFPDLPVPDPSQNATDEFESCDYLSGRVGVLKYKYYQRYPERRITRLNSVLNNREHEPRIVVFLKAKLADGAIEYFVDCADSSPNSRFGFLFTLLFGDEIEIASGVFTLRPVESSAFSIDENLSELLGEFDRVCAEGWIESLRKGPTGIGYTFESLLGIKENNEQIADFKGIEIKCKGIKEDAADSTGKLNLFQRAPVWAQKMSTKERIRQVGKASANGLFRCHSQVTTTANNVGLSLRVLDVERKIDLQKLAEPLGHWTFEALQKRLEEKHSRAVFVKAKIQEKESKRFFKYEELVYCERPSMDRFVDLVGHRNLVFEFMMSERPGGEIKNHGYPWRLIREEFLESLFSFQIKLRQKQIKN